MLNILHLFKSHHCLSCDHVSTWKVIISFQSLKSIGVFHLETCSWVFKYSIKFHILEVPSL